jgi:hypothetical protein
LLANVGHEFGSIINKIGDVWLLRFGGLFHMFNK